MRAVQVREFGGPEVLEPFDLPDPVVGAGQVLVRVAHAGITFIETQFRTTGRGPFTVTPPYIPGNGVAGVVEVVADDVDPALIGERVVTTTGGFGGYAELAAAPADGLITVPDALDLDAAVALLADGRTATALIDAVNLQPGAVVLVEAAAGGVGTLLVQLATNAGARVVAVAGGERKLAVTRDLGAELAVDYLQPGWDGAVRAAIGNVDIVFDGVGGAIARDAFGLIGRGGSMVNFGGASGQWGGIDAGDADEHDVRLIGLPRPTPEESKALTGRALAAATAGHLRPVIGQRFPLARASEAHRAIESRETIGKTLLDTTAG